MPVSESIHAIQMVLLFLLVLVALFAALAQRLKLPYPILLVLAGLGISFIPHVPRVRLEPDLIFLIFLPPLLYAAAWQTNWRGFRENLLSISMLAVGLVAFTVWGVAEFADRFVTALDWKTGFVLGAVVATTDAIAATAIAKTIGLPQRIVDVLEGESLINDATGLLALEFGLSMLLRDQTPTAGAGALRLLWLAGGGIGVGLAVGWVTAWLEGMIDDGPVEMALSVIVPYAAYLAGEEVKASGVLAVVACGLYLSRKSAEFFSPTVRLQIWGAWTSLNFVLNGLVFVLIGLQLPYVLAGIRGYGRWTLIAYGAIFSLMLIVLRIAWVFPGARVSWWVRRHLLHQKGAPPSARQIFVVGWTGMRGVVALAAAFSLPETLGDGRPFAQRNLIIFLTFSVILVTLVLQGLTLPALIRWLGLGSAMPEGGDEERDARVAVLKEAIAFLEEGASGASTDPLHAPEADAHGYDDLLHRYRHRLEALSDDDDAGHARTFHHRLTLARQTVQVERRTLLRLRDEGRIDDEIQRRLERELDLTEARQGAAE